MKYLAAALVVALLLHFPHLVGLAGQFATVAASMAAYAATYGLTHAWTLALALVVVLHRLGACRWGW